MVHSARGQTQPGNVGKCGSPGGRRRAVLNQQRTRLSDKGPSCPLELDRNSRRHSEHSSKQRELVISRLTLQEMLS